VAVLPFLAVLFALLIGPVRSRLRLHGKDAD
jgi:hypothetical protein